MFCPSCGIALPNQLKYCNRGGAPLTTPRENELVKLYEKRMEGEMEGLFWIIVFGLGLLIGGMVVLKKALDLNEKVLISLSAPVLDRVDHVLRIGRLADTSSGSKFQRGERNYAVRTSRDERTQSRTDTADA
jgi:hypothetical protein